MTETRTRIVASLLICVAALIASGAEATLLTPETHLQMDRVGSPVAEPKGTLIAYTVSRLNAAGDGRETQIWLLDLSTGRSRQVTEGADSKAPAWDPDGSVLYFLREGQVWRLSMEEGGPEQVTNLPRRVGGYRLNPDPHAPPERRMAISARVHPDCPNVDWDCTDRAAKRWDGRAGLVSELFPLRHWSSWRDSLDTHIFIGDPEENRWTDITTDPASRAPFALAGGSKFTFAPHGKSLALIRNLDPDVALSTNNDIFLATLGDPPFSLVRHLLSHGLSGGGGNDDQPTFSPDGLAIAYTSMKRAGYESDLRMIVLHDLESGHERCLTCDLDRSAYGLTWSDDSRYLYFTAYDHEASCLYRVDLESGSVQPLLRAGGIWGLESLPDGRLLLMLESSRMPGELFICDPDFLAGQPERWLNDITPQADGRFGTSDAAGSTDEALRQLTFHNWDLLRDLEMCPIEHLRFVGALGDSVHGMIVKPPSAAIKAHGRDPENLPLVLVLHGGPQWAYHDFWLRSYNFQMIASAGYAVATINFHGSAGFGIEFQDAIRGHWGDVPGEDVERGLDYLIERYDFVDPNRVAAIGRSFGGYLVNWLNGQTDRFSCFVSHSGGFDEATGWGTTEELWFPEWEFYGTPWDQREVYKANSPSTYADEMRTPTLVIHGQKDYRVDLSDGLQMYTTLRRQDVSARFLTFPHQGHHIHDPASWRLMWDEIFAWLKRHID